MFEIGKKYKATFHDRIVECTHLYNNNKAAILKVLKSDQKGCFIPGEEYAVDNYGDMVKKYYEEYHEPKVIVEERYVAIWSKTELHLTPEEQGGLKRIGKIRVTYTEGRGVKVDVLEGADTSNA